ncbi:MAG: hypothetical protein COB85_00255 [Bacteroidetes bacterium]|nr:MAG: hypothetical protein COB85_00255 [Bacteroidota bacterium]
MRIISVIIILLLFVQSAIGQYNLDYGIKLGAANYLGEMGGTSKEGKGTPAKGFISDLRFDKTRYCFGAWVRYKVHPLLSVKANLGVIRITGADSLSDYANRKGRNLSFRNDLVELNAQFEYNFYTAQDITSRGKTRMDFGTFVFIGGGMFWNNPKAKYEGKWVALQPLGTEGQGRIQKENNKGEMEDFKKYKRIVAMLHGGLGLHYTIKRKYRIGWETAVRYTFTDYIDDVSDRYAPAGTFDSDADSKAEDLANNSDYADVMTNGVVQPSQYSPGSLRGNPKKNDWYMTMEFTFGYVVRGKSNFYRSKYKFITGAKKRRKRKTRAKF